MRVEGDFFKENWMEKWQKENVTFQFPPTANEDNVIWSQGPQQLVNGRQGKIVL